MAPSSSKSAGASASDCPECSSAKAMTSAVPASAQIQNSIEGRCRCSHAPTAAVASGRMPTITLACTAPTWRMAVDVSSGNPNTTPAEVIASGTQSLRRGNGARVAARNAADSRPAIAARPSAMNAPDICGASAGPTARRVMGSVSAKIATPSAPSQRPLRSSGFRRACRDMRLTVPLRTSTPPVQSAGSLRHLYRPVRQYTKGLPRC